MLGAGGMVTLIRLNQQLIDQKGREWGIPNLSALALGGGVALGAALGGIGGALLTRILSRNAPQGQVDALQARLAAARREFETLRQDLAANALEPQHHRLAVERLFAELVG